MTTYNSVLNSEYIPKERPYSKNELQYLHQKLFKNIRLGNDKVIHNKCKHFYYIRENSKKEKEIKDKGVNIDIGNCSVCWKLNNTPDYLRKKAHNMVQNYFEKFEDVENITYDFLDLETVFYKWLYIENYDKKSYD
jgi:hypothetical protein